MAAQNNKNSQNTEKSPYADFVKRRRRLKRAAWALRIIEMVITTIFAMFMGIFIPLCAWLGLDDQPLALDISNVYWFFSAIVYVIGFFAIMLDSTFIGACMHVAAAVGIIMTHFGFIRFSVNFPDSPVPSPALYLPCLSITALSIAIMLMVKIPQLNDKKKLREEKKAPSILEDSDNADKNAEDESVGDD